MKKTLNRIAFIGMMGTGKSISGRKIAEKLQLSFSDLDDVLINRMGMSIAQAFIVFGEKVFRDYETNALLEVVWNERIVIACGGGVALKKENMDILDGYIKVRLTASPDTIYNRIKDDFTRPLIKDNSPPALAKIIDERESKYAEYADITVNTDNKSIEEVVEEIIKELEKHK
ncbi:MAG: shikimate kinase [Firmicutes bacterium]|nr:shikimate kinase [Bacillota bacterium]